MGWIVFISTIVIVFFFFFILSIIPLIFVFKKFYKTNECSYMMEDRGGGKKRNVKGKILIRTKSSVSL